MVILTPGWIAMKSFAIFCSVSSRRPWVKECQKTISPCKSSALAAGDDPLAAGAAELDAPEPQATRLSTSTNASKSAVIFRVIFFSSYTT
ncbi:hypothetical protein [Ruthenibacterium lactatiformans]